MFSTLFFQKRCLSYFSIPSGICAVHKPIGISSQAVVTRIKYVLIDEVKRTKGVKLKHGKIKVGHGIIFSNIIDIFYLFLFLLRWYARSSC
jgi:hypothetical protein